MKKLIVACELIVVFLVIAKIVTVGGMLAHFRPVEELFSEKVLCAEPPEKKGLQAQAVPATEHQSSQEKELLRSLMEKQEYIRKQEDALRRREERLNAMRAEILRKIEELRETETRVAVYLDEIEKADKERYKDLAKVYEASPPEQASAMLEKLDVKTAAAIIMNMKSAKAGAIWGYLNSATAVAITREITEKRLVEKAEKTL